MHSESSRVAAEVPSSGAVGEMLMVGRCLVHQQAVLAAFHPANLVSAACEALHTQVILCQFTPVSCQPEFSLWGCY